MRPTLLCLLLSLPALADTYMVGGTDWDARNFDQCPYFYDPIMQSTSPTSFNTTFGPSKPFDVATWSGTAGGTSHHWVFVSTSTGVQVLDFTNGDTPAPSAIQMSYSSTRAWGLDLVGSYPNKKLLTVANSRLEIYSLNWANPKLSPQLPAVQLNVIQNGLQPCADESGANNDDDAGSIDVVGTADGLVFVANECTGSARGSVDVIDITTNPATLKQRVRVDKAPVGLALASNENFLLLVNEGAKATSLSAGGFTTTGTIGDHVGSLMAFQINHTTKSISLKSAVNAGCAPVRVFNDGNGHAWVSARSSNEVVAFDINDLIGGTYAWRSRLARLLVGPEPVGLRTLDNGQLLAVANSFRTSDSSGVDPNHASYPAPSTMIFRVSDVTLSYNSSTMRQDPGFCLAYGTPTGFGDFPRNFGSSDDRLYLALNGASAVRWWSTSFLHDNCF
jgi:hypothetical protein